MSTSHESSTVTANQLDWGAACIAASQEDDKFLSFRSSYAFLRVVEGSPKEAGYWNLRRLLGSQLFKTTLPLLQLSDAVGLPSNLITFKVDRTYSLSPTTLRYANNAINVINLFDEEIMRCGVIYEIGGGYGGEATVFNHFSRSLFDAEIGDRWCIYDLPSSYSLISRFMHCFEYEVTIKKDTEITSDINLVISNGALSEMWGQDLDIYLKNVVAPAKCGYFITNFDSHSAPYGGITTAKFLRILKDMGKDDVTVLPSSQYLSRFDEDAGTKLIVFGHDCNKLKNMDNYYCKKGYFSQSLFKLLKAIDRINQIISKLYLK
jgi:hypothetical protein